MHPGGRAFRLLEVLTVGFPFCAFKVLTGLVLLGFRGGSFAGGVLVAVGAIDLLLNLIALAYAALGRGNALPVCAAQWLVARRGAGRSSWWRLGLSVDTMFAFTLVALVIGLGWLAHLSRPALAAWNLSVVFNVLGAGLGRLAESVLDVSASGKSPVRPETVAPGADA